MIDFKEIPVANSGEGNQDNFELFARDFFETLGYQIIENPSRGADGGRDLIIKEIRKGTSDFTTEILWLVSCKHYAHSRKSITPTIENNIMDRISANGCDGFIGFYSTLPSEGLTKIFKNISTQIFDHKKIEKHIVGNEKLKHIFMRFFPMSYKKWDLLNLPYNPIKLFSFYLNAKHEAELNLLESIFGNIDNVFIALVNSQNFDEFLKFKEIKLYTLENINDGLDKLYKENQLKYSSSFTSLMSVYDDFLNNYLQEKGYKKEKIIRTNIGFSKNSIEILSTSTLIVNRAKMKELENMYIELKDII